MKVLLTGVTGQIGRELQRTLSRLGTVVPADRGMLDLADRDSIVKAVRAIKPSLIVNPAAFTAVDLAESQPGVAAQVNSVAPGILAAEAKRLGAGLIHFSTDYVFDGEKPDPYVETDAPHPLSVYGRTKLAGEQAIAEAGGRFLILRTSWVYSPRGKNFLRTILGLAQDRPEIRVVNDQRGAPTSAACIADAVADIIAHATAPGSDWPGGIYHLSCSGETTWFGFAAAILEKRTGPRPSLVPIPTSEYPTPARRPKNSLLSNRKLADAFGIRMPDWRVALEACLRQIP